MHVCFRELFWHVSLICCVCDFFFLVVTTNTSLLLLLLLLVHHQDEAQTKDVRLREQTHRVRRTHGKDVNKEHMRHTTTNKIANG